MEVLDQSPASFASWRLDVTRSTLVHPAGALWLRAAYSARCQSLICSCLLLIARFFRSMLGFTESLLA
jgi:hypothetical protein